LCNATACLESSGATELPEDVAVAHHELILRKLGAGRSFPDLLESYPQLSKDDLRAALAFAADHMQHETVLAAE